MNSKGTLFILNQQTLPKGLVEFYGPDGQEEIVFEKYLSFKEELAIRGILIEQMTLDFKGSWSITIRPDITIRFGKENITERFNRFLMKEHIGHSADDDRLFDAIPQEFSDYINDKMKRFISKRDWGYIDIQRLSLIHI